MPIEPNAVTPTEQAEEAVDFVAVIDENGDIQVEPREKTPATPSPTEPAVVAATVQEPSPATEPGPEDDDESGLTPEEIAVLKRKTKERMQTLSRRSKAAEQREAAERERRQALEREVANLKTQNTAFETHSVEASESVVDAQIAAAATKYKQAREVGNAEDELAAVAEMSQAQARKLAIEAYKQQRPEPSKAATPTPAAQVQPAVVVDNPRAHQATAQWIEKNSAWFGKDPVLTQATKAIHDTLLISEGFRPDLDDPDIGYPAYFAEIDKRLKDYFPGRFQSQPAKPQGKQVVTTPSRSPSASPTQETSRKVKVSLTPRQIAWAREQGIPLENMIKEQARIEAAKVRRS